MLKSVKPLSIYVTHGFMAFFIALISIFSIIVFDVWNSLPSLGTSTNMLGDHSIVITDRNQGELFRLFSNKDRVVIDIATLPPYVTQAFIAIEDERFYERSCIDLTAIARATHANLSQAKSQGASTITQQLARSVFLTPEKTYSRKFKEILLSCKLEWKFSKDELLSMYINWIAFGGSSYGIEQASTKYFGKHAKELTLPEAAVLAALPQRPSYFSPYGPNVRSSSDRIGLLPTYAPNSQTELLSSRSTQVLSAMVNNGYITKEQFLQGVQELLTVKFSEPTYSIEAPHFVFWVRNQVEEIMQQRSSNGVQVTSTIHSGLQRLAEETVLKNVERVKTEYGASNIALLSVDRKTQEIVAYVGNTDYFADMSGQVDMVQAARQPGSSFKAIVYATAFMAGISPDSFITDEPITLGNYSPKNYEGGYFGRMTIKQALSTSRNIPAIKAFYWGGGEEAVLNTAKLLGILTPSIQKKAAKKTNPWFTYGWPLALGSAEVTLLEMVQAYSVFANEGVFIPVTGIRFVRDSSTSETIYAYDATASSKQVVPKEVATAIDSILHDEAARPSGFWREQLTLPGGSTVKTGTSSKCVREAQGVCTEIAANNTWLIGYNQDLITGVWVGNADGSALTGEANGISTVSPIWRDFMIEASVFTQK